MATRKLDARRAKRVYVLIAGLSMIAGGIALISGHIATQSRLNESAGICFFLVFLVGYAIVGFASADAGCWGATLWGPIVITFGGIVGLTIISEGSGYFFLMAIYGIVVANIAYVIAWCFRGASSNVECGIAACCTCGYDLTGNTSGRCPECGNMLPKN